MSTDITYCHNFNPLLFVTLFLQYMERYEQGVNLYVWLSQTVSVKAQLDFIGKINFPLDRLSHTEVLGNSKIYAELEAN